MGGAKNRWRNRCYVEDGPSRTRAMIRNRHHLHSWLRTRIGLYRPHIHVQPCDIRCEPLAANHHTPSPVASYRLASDITIVNLHPEPTRQKHSSSPHYFIDRTVTGENGAPSEPHRQRDCNHDTTRQTLYETDDNLSHTADTFSLAGAPRITPNRRSDSRQDTHHNLHRTLNQRHRSDDKGARECADTSDIIPSLSTIITSQDLVSRRTQRLLNGAIAHPELSLTHLALERTLPFERDPWMQRVDNTRVPVKQ